MKKIIRLTESDLTRIVNRVINEGENEQVYQRIKEIIDKMKPNFISDIEFELRPLKVWDDKDEVHKNYDDISDDYKKQHKKEYRLVLYFVFPPGSKYLKTTDERGGIEYIDFYGPMYDLNQAIRDAIIDELGIKIISSTMGMKSSDGRFIDPLVDRRYR